MCNILCFTTKFSSIFCVLAFPKMSKKRSGFVDFAKNAKKQHLENRDNTPFYKFVKSPLWSKVAKSAKNTIY